MKHLLENHISNLQRKTISLSNIGAALTSFVISVIGKVVNLNEP